LKVVQRASFYNSFELYQQGMNWKFSAPWRPRRRRGVSTRNELKDAADDPLQVVAGLVSTRNELKASSPRWRWRCGGSVSTRNELKARDQGRLQAAAVPLYQQGMNWKSRAPPAAAWPSPYQQGMNWKNR